MNGKSLQITGSFFQSSRLIIRLLKTRRYSSYSTKRDCKLTGYTKIASKEGTFNRDLFFCP